MKVDISYSVMTSRHNDAVQQCIDDIRRGRSKAKDTDPSTWQWYYYWSTCVDDTTRTTGSVDERVADTLRRSMPVAVRVDIGRTWSYATLPADYVPPEVAAQITSYYTVQEAETQRVAALSPAARRSELEQLLSQLSGSPGFFAIRSPR